MNDGKWVQIVQKNKHYKHIQLHAQWGLVLCIPLDTLELLSKRSKLTPHELHRYALHYQTIPVLLNLLCTIPLMLALFLFWHRAGFLLSQTSQRILAKIVRIFRNCSHDHSRQCAELDPTNLKMSPCELRKSKLSLSHTTHTWWRKSNNNLIKSATVDWADSSNP